jgi:hypothetical protein
MNPHILPTDVITLLVDTAVPLVVEAASSTITKKELFEREIYFNAMLAGMMLTLKYIHLLRSPVDLQLTTMPTAEDLNAHGVAIEHRFLTALETNQPTLTLHEPNEDLNNRWHGLCAMDSFLYEYAEQKRQLELEHIYSLSCRRLRSTSSCTLM